MVIRKQCDGFVAVKISTIDGFYDWMVGQTTPLVVGDENPYDWAYEWDYERYISGLDVID